MKTLRIATLKICLFIAGLIAASTQAQESQRVVGTTTALTYAAQAKQIAPAKTVIVAVDLTGSFVTYILADGYMDRAVKRTMQEIDTNIQTGSMVRVGVIGHSHHDESNSFDHLLAREWKVGGRYTKEKVMSGVRAWLHDIETDLRSGKLQPEKNTAVVMALDRISEFTQKSNGSCLVIAVSDLDDTEFGLPLPAPYRSGELKGCEVTAIGAGVTLRGGTKAERQLRQAWEAWFKQAGVDIVDFHWLPNP